MTDKEMYELLCKKAENIKMHMDAGDVAEIAERFRAITAHNNKLKPVFSKYYETVWFCPFCDECHSIYDKFDYCPDCSQAIEWDKDE